MDDCIFCKIVNGSIPSFKVYENENFLAFLSIAPIKPGHTLVIPKKHSEYLFDMEEAALSGLMAASKPVAKILQEKLQPKTGKIGVMVAGLEVAHTHLHLIPMDEEGDLNFEKASPASSQKLADILQILSS